MKFHFCAGVDCGMPSLVISCTLLKGIKHQFTLCALIIRKTCRYSVVLFALLLVDSFSLTFHERHQRLVSHASARALGSRYYSVHLFYSLAMLAGGSCIYQNKVYQKVLRGDRFLHCFCFFK